MEHLSGSVGEASDFSSGHDLTAYYYYYYYYYLLLILFNFLIGNLVESFKQVFFRLVCYSLVDYEIYFEGLV